MEFKVTASDLLTGASRCTNTNTEVQTQIQQMQSYVLQLMSGYQGDAALAMQNVCAEWNSDAAALNYVLSTIAQGLTVNSSNYTDNETTNTKNFTNIATTLPPAAF